MKTSTDVCVLASAVGLVGGAAKATRLLCESLAEIGHRVTLFVTLPPDDTTRAHLAERGVSIATPWISKGWRLDLPQRQIALRLWLWALRRADVSIISVSLSAEAFYLLALPAVARRLALWETTEALPHVKFLHQGIYRRLRSVAAVLCPSGLVERNVRATYGYEGPILRLPFWVEAAPAPANLEAPRSRRFLYVGRLDPDKGFRYLFAAFSSVRARWPDARLTVRGGGDASSLAELGSNQPGVDVGGYLCADDYERELNTCEAVVLPSLHEGYPLSLLEACARGRPIIATLVGSIPEVFGDRTAAILVPPADSDALADAMLRMLEEDDAAHQARRRDASDAFGALSGPHVVRDSLMKVLNVIRAPRA